jgi:hypothetical protein
MSLHIKRHIDNWLVHAVGLERNKLESVFNFANVFCLRRQRCRTLKRGRRTSLSYNARLLKS